MKSSSSSAEHSRRSAPVETAAQHSAGGDLADECPRCGEPITFELKLTDDGPTWLGACVECNAIVEALL